MSKSLIMKLQSNNQPHFQFPIDLGSSSSKVDFKKSEKINEDENLEYDQYGNPVYVASIVLDTYTRNK
jgi:hypothetical protein